MNHIFAETLYLIDAWKRGADSDDYASEIAALRQAIKDTALQKLTDIHQEIEADEQAANTHLIAAAPDLLEALQALVAGLDATNWSSWQTTAHFSQQHDDARAAIAKATGEKE